MAVFTRRETPPHFSDHRRYFPFLRRDFEYQCVYCERTEGYMGGEGSFEVEHFRPSSRFPELVCFYGNLYYACRKCNSHKSRTWPTEDQVASGLRFADPCEEDLYAQHVLERDDGLIEPVTGCGQYSCQHIRLHRGELRTFRQLRVQARLDLPIWLGLVRRLEQLLPYASRAERDDIDREINAVMERIVESKRRFSLE